MKNTLVAKTLTASVSGNAHDTFARLSEPAQLPQWHSSFCRSLRRQEGGYVAETPKGAQNVRFIRADHAMVVDILVEAVEGIELLSAIRVLPNGEGSEIVWTLVKAEGISDAIFNEHVRWAGNALQALRKAPADKPQPVIEETFVASEKPADAPAAPARPTPEPVPATPGKKLFIGNLSYDWTDEQLRAHFSELGAITLAEVARFRGRGGRSRGFGFVEMTTVEEAQAAIDKLHGVMAGGRELIVRFAKSQESRAAKPEEAAGTSPEAAPSPVTVPNENAEDEGPGPGNELNPPPQRARQDRPRRGGMRPRHGQSQGQRGPAPRRTAPRGGYREVDITNKSGYEIFPRRAPGSPEPVRSPEPERSRTRLETSPYMDDTGDIENHGRRPSHRRRR